jgi:RsiW-degrading membrane proteinase PrsW (M82 family)
MYFRLKDRYEPEPASVVSRAFILGAVMVFPAGLIEAPFRPILVSPPNLVVLALTVIVGVGLVEEYLKYWVVRKYIYPHPEFNEPVDGIIYTVSAGLGFAAFENVLYAASYGLTVGIVRAVLTSIVHASFSGIVGYSLGVAKFSPPEQARGMVARGIMAAAILHGLYDFLLMTGIMNFYFTVLVVFLLYAGLGGRIRTALHASPFHPDREDR